VAGAAVVLAGLTGGWAATRAVSGQSPLTTVTVASASTTLRPHTDELGFIAQVPQDWEERRSEGAVSFVSPDGSQELTMSRAASVDDVTAGLGAAQVDPAQPAPGGGATQLVFHTTEDERRRTGWLRFVPTQDGVLAVRLTAPGGSSESVTAELFENVAGRVAPIA
jgi:eukaryotic-like serine/threonine-protein kinase